jgi:hypothetical protein
MDRSFAHRRAMRSYGYGRRPNPTLVLETELPRALHGLGELGGRKRVEHIFLR